MIDESDVGSLRILTGALGATTSGVLITDVSLPDNPIIYANPGFERMTGYSRDDVLGRNCRFLQGEDTDREAVARLRAAIAAGEEHKVTLRNYRKDGTPFWNELSISPVYDGERLTHFIGIQTDVSDREKADQLQIALDLAESIYETVREGLLILDADLRVFRANRAFCRIFGTTREATEGRPLYELGDHEWDIPALRTLLEQLLPSQNPFDDFEVAHEFSGIGHRTMLLNARRLDREGLPEFILLAIEDLTERQAHLARLREIESRYRLLAAKIRDYAIVLLDAEGGVTDWNPGAEGIYGYAEDEILGASYRRLYPPEEQADGRPERELREAGERGEVAGDGWQVRKDESRFWASGVTTALSDEQGRLRGFSRIVRDLSELKRVEQELIGRADSLSDRDRAKDEFLAMLSHELRNPLNAIAGALHLAHPLAESDPELRGPLEIAIHQVAQMTALIDDLLEVSRVTQGKLELRAKRIALDAVLASSVRGAEAKLGGRPLRFATRIAPDVQVDGDPLRLDQVFGNLLGNAVKFSAGGEIRVSLAVEDGRAVVRISDDGVGIEPDVLPHVFDLFQQGERTLERAEGGLGIGLTISRQLVTLHGGGIEVASEGRGRGATFTVRLPLAPADGTVVAAPAAAASPPEGAGRGLGAVVVDDNEDAANILVKLLKRQGFEARAVYHGDAVLAAVRDAAPDVVFLDIGLPGKDGYEVAREIRADAALDAVRLIALTGYGMESDRARAREAGFDLHLLKPLSMDALRDVLARVAAGTL